MSLGNTILTPINTEHTVNIVSFPRRSNVRFMSVERGKVVHPLCGSRNHRCSRERSIRQEPKTAQAAAVVMTTKDVRADARSVRHAAEGKQRAFGTFSAALARQLMITMTINLVSYFFIIHFSLFWLSEIPFFTFAPTELPVSVIDPFDLIHLSLSKRIRRRLIAFSFVEIKTGKIINKY